MQMDLAASARITSVTMWRELTGVTDFAPVLLAAAAAAEYGAMFAALAGAMAGDPGERGRPAGACACGTCWCSPCRAGRLAGRRGR